jgi:hypothetical protein
LTAILMGLTKPNSSHRNWTSQGGYLTLARRFQQHYAGLIELDHACQEARKDSLSGMQHPVLASPSIVNLSYCFRDRNCLQ